MAHSALTREQILTLLAEGPARITALIAGLTPAQLRTAPAPGAWAATAVLAHLRSCADVWATASRRSLRRSSRPSVPSIPRRGSNELIMLPSTFSPLLTPLPPSAQHSLRA